MSSRRKSSTPCMVRVQDQPEEAMDLDAMDLDAMDVDASADGDAIDAAAAVTETEQPSESAEKTPEPREENQQNPEPLEHEEDGDRTPVGEDVDATVTAAAEEKSGDAGDTADSSDSSDPASQVKPRGYECKYCPFSTQNLNDFKEHVDSNHPNVILNPLYLCAVCNFNTKKFDSLTEHNEERHRGETAFKFRRIKMNNQTVLEQSIEGKENAAENAADGETLAGDTNGGFVATAVKTPNSLQTPFQEPKSQRDGLVQKNQITAVNINGTVIIPEPAAILQGLSHVTPLLQRPPNISSVPKIAVPLNTTKYNPTLDDNLTLITSFNKFPYPTHAELSWLTAASKHPEDQIKVWFTTQRLKQGITWSPEEVEEARKKMFNGSIPPAHHTFTVLPTSAAVSAAAPPARSSQQPFVHTTVGLVRTTASNGLNVAATANSLKRSLATHLTTVFGPESKRPIMAVAPHSGDAKDRGLMAPPPPPPPKDRLPMAPPPPALVEMKRPVALPVVEMKRPSVSVPLMPPPSSSLSPSSSKLKVPPSGNPKTKPVVSLPSIVFPESLTRPLIVPPPIFAPPFKNSLLFPLNPSKDKHPNVHAPPAADMKLPNSPPPLSPQLRRPPIIQSIRAPAKAPPPNPGFPSDRKLKEQHGVELKLSYNKVLTPLADANGTSRIDAKWSHEHAHNGVHYEAALKPDFQQKSSVLTQFPLLERMKGKSAEQLKVLEENFLRNSFPSLGDVDALAGATRLSHQEIDSWFVERRALRDNLEQALLNSMGTKRPGGAGAGIAAIARKRLHQQQNHQTLHLNGVHKAGGGADLLKTPPIVAPAPNRNSCSVPPDSRPAPILSDDLAVARWPSPEEFSQLEGRTGRAELARWFTDSRLHGSGSVSGGGLELNELFRNNGVNVGQAAPAKNGPNGPNAAALNLGGSNKVLEVELGWLMEQRANSINANSNDQIHERLAGRLRQQKGAELKNGGDGSGRDLFGVWLDDGQLRGRELRLLDRERTNDDASGRLSG